MAGNSDYVVDASFVLAALLPDERQGEVDKMFKLFVEGSVNFFSSVLLPFEVLNGLRAAILTKRITSQKARLLVGYVLKWGIVYEPVAFEEVFALAVKKDLSVYDAGYLYLALEKRSKLLSLDRKLSRLAKVK